MAETKTTARAPRIAWGVRYSMSFVVPTCIILQHYITSHHIMLAGWRHACIMMNDATANNSRIQKDDSTRRPNSAISRLWCCRANDAVESSLTVRNVVSSHHQEHTCKAQAGTATPTTSDCCPSAIQTTPQGQEELHMQAAAASEARMTTMMTMPILSPLHKWLSSFYRSDPRYQLKEYFARIVVKKVAPAVMSSGISSGSIKETPTDEAAAAAAAVMSSTDVFTIWRPTSADAIRRMIKREATGKGLEIKGKSAKQGKLSGFVPFLQIDNEDHKTKIRSIPRDGRVRIYFASDEARLAVLEELEPYQDKMLNAVQDAKRFVVKSFLYRPAAVGGVVVDTAIASVKESGSQLKNGVVDSTQRLEAAGKQAGSAAVAVGAAIGVDKVISSVNSSTVQIKKQTVSAVKSSTSSMVSSTNEIKRQAASVASSMAKTTGIGTVATSVKSATVIMAKHAESTIARTSRAFIASAKSVPEIDFAFKRLLWDMDDPSVKIIDTHVPEHYGIELPDRLLWEAFVADRDISRPEGSNYCTGRPSQPAFQDMNFIAIYNTRKNQTASKKAKVDEPRVVLFQTCDKDEDPMDPRGLVMAYEEDGRVVPVVSDFDCFTMGTRGVSFESPLPKKQIELLQWCISQMEDVLETQDSESPKITSWTSCWLDVLKRNMAEGFHPEIPRFGFGDATSYEIVAEAVSWLKDTGAVRHGAECFNYYFPQELDDEFLVVSKDLPGSVPWRYMNVNELQDFLMRKAEEGFTFPLNPKWILCDPNWKHIHDRLLSSRDPNVQESLKVWFPVDSGVRERIETISSKHPSGFVCDRPTQFSGTEAMDLATLELDQFMVLNRVRRKLHCVAAFTQLLNSVRKKRLAAAVSSDNVVS